MSRAPGDSLELNLPTQHGWLLLAPAVNVVGLLLLYPLLLQNFVAQPGLAVLPPPSEFVLEDFNQALQVWLPAGEGALRFQGRNLSLDDFAAALRQRREAGAATLVIHADRAASHERVFALTELANASGLRVGYAALSPDLASAAAPAPTDEPQP